MVAELQQKTLDTFSNLTQKATEVNENILETINNLNVNRNSKHTKK